MDTARGCVWFASRAACGAVCWVTAGIAGSLPGARAVTERRSIPVVQTGRPMPDSTTCDHNWYWRRKRNADRGYWECIRCGARSEWIGLTPEGRPGEGPPDAR